MNNEKKYPLIVNGSSNNEYPNDWQMTAINSAKAGNYTYHWISPSHLGSKNYGWMRYPGKGGK